MKAPFYIILALCIVCYPFHFTTPTESMDGWYIVASFLLFSFSHVNIFHLLANIYALYRFNPRNDTALLAFLITLFTHAILSIVFCYEPPTSGLSVFIYAAIARRYAAWQSSILLPVISNLSFIAINYFTDALYFNWPAHIIAFISSYLFYRLIYYPYTSS